MSFSIPKITCAEIKPFSGEQIIEINGLLYTIKPLKEENPEPEVIEIKDSEGNDSSPVQVKFEEEAAEYSGFGVKIPVIVEGSSISLQNQSTVAESNSPKRIKIAEESSIVKVEDSQTTFVINEVQEAEQGDCIENFEALYEEYTEEYNPFIADEEPAETTKESPVILVNENGSVIQDFQIIVYDGSADLHQHERKQLTRREDLSSLNVIQLLAALSELQEKHFKKKFANFIALKYSLEPSVLKFFAKFHNSAVGKDISAELFRSENKIVKTMENKLRENPKMSVDQYLNDMETIIAKRLKKDADKIEIHHKYFFVQHFANKLYQLSVFLLNRKESITLKPTPYRSKKKESKQNTLSLEMDISALKDILAVQVIAAIVEYKINPDERIYNTYGVEICFLMNFLSKDLRPKIFLSNEQEQSIRLALHKRIFNDCRMNLLYFTNLLRFLIAQQEGKKVTRCFLKGHHVNFYVAHFAPQLYSVAKGPAKLWKELKNHEQNKELQVFKRIKSSCVG